MRPPIRQNQSLQLSRIIPAIAEEESFAPKGGTAIKPFYRDMPRLSLDIDLDDHIQKGLWPSSIASSRDLPMSRS